MSKLRSLVLATLVLAVISPRTKATIPIPTEAEHAISLDGTWRFKLEQAPAGYPVATARPMAARNLA